MGTSPARERAQGRGWTLKGALGSSVAAPPPAPPEPAPHRLQLQDSESVTVHLLSDSALASGERPTDFVEIIGMVAEDGSVREQLAAFLPTGGTPFDLATYNEVVCLAADKFAPLFRD